MEACQSIFVIDDTVILAELFTSVVHSNSPSYTSHTGSLSTIVDSYGDIVVAPLADSAISA